MRKAKSEFRKKIGNNKPSKRVPSRKVLGEARNFIRVPETMGCAQVLPAVLFACANLVSHQ